MTKPAIGIQYFYSKNMIRLIKRGNYKLSETPRSTRILSLDENKNFAWVNAAHIGEILVSAKKPDKRESILAIGKYRLYVVKNEKRLTDLTHLELSVGEGRWQGYLLPVGMPNGVKRRRIVPTNEIITKTIY